LGAVQVLQKTLPLQLADRHDGHGGRQLDDGGRFR
jgi:hypothetical protein